MPRRAVKIPVLWSKTFAPSKYIAPIPNDPNTTLMMTREVLASETTRSSNLPIIE